MPLRKFEGWLFKHSNCSYRRRVTCRPISIPGSEWSAIQNRESVLDSRYMRWHWRHRSKWKNCHVKFPKFQTKCVGYRHDLVGNSIFTLRDELWLTSRSSRVASAIWMGWWFIANLQLSTPLKECRKSVNTAWVMTKSLQSVSTQWSGPPLFHGYATDISDLFSGVFSFFAFVR